MTTQRIHRAVGGAIVIVLTTATLALANTFPVVSRSLTVIGTCTLTANPSTTTVTADTEARQGSATSNFGTATSMNVASGSSLNRRIYIRFDLTKCSPAIPSTVTVKLATLRLFVTALPAVCRTHDIFRVTSSWTESTLTWNNQPFGTSINNPASGSRTSSLDVGASPCQNSASTQYVTGWAVAADVQAFVSGTATNNGWMIRDDVEGSSTTRTGTYSTKNLGTLARAPQLVVTYTV